MLEVLAVLEAQEVLVVQVVMVVIKAKSIILRHLLYTLRLIIIVLPVVTLTYVYNHNKLELNGVNIVMVDTRLLLHINGLHIIEKEEYKATTVQTLLALKTLHHLVEPEEPVVLAVAVELAEQAVTDVVTTKL